MRCPERQRGGPNIKLAYLDQACQASANFCLAPFVFYEVITGRELP